MKWIKLGQLFSPDQQLWWSKKYALYPTPFYFPGENLIRIYFGSVDENYYGRTSYLDVDAENPMQILFNPGKPILDLGLKGTFDDCGATPASLIAKGNDYYLYYNGFSRSHQTPYQIFSGLAVSKDGIKFEKHSHVPVLERTHEEYFDRAGQCVCVEGDIYKTWYVSGLKWELLNSDLFKNKMMPVHTIRYASSKDGIRWEASREPCLSFEHEDEFGFGRPWVMKTRNGHSMWYSIRKKNSPYRLGYAESVDGIHWIRKDRETGIEPSAQGWDSEMICFASIISVKEKTYMFYNGNDHGATGFGVAELAGSF